MQIQENFQELQIVETFCTHQKISGLKFIEIYEKYCIDINEKCPKQCKFNHNNEIDKILKGE